MAIPDANVTASAPPEQPDASADPLVAKILSNFIKQYTTKDIPEQDGIIESCYTKDAVFDDNLFHVTGHANIKVQFHAVAKLFGDVKVDIKHATKEPLEVVPGGALIKVYNVQQYTMGKRVIPIECDTTFKVNAEGLITSHYDKWRKRWANFGWFKRVGGSFTSAIMKAVKY